MRRRRRRREQWPCEGGRGKTGSHTEMGVWRRNVEGSVEEKGELLKKKLLCMW